MHAAQIMASVLIITLLILICSMKQIIYFQSEVLSLVVQRRIFLNYSYVLKYPGISKTCFQCKLDLLDHKSYHLKFHWTCKFCKLYQYKLYPKSVKALHKREIQEQTWYKLVCNYCDKKFVEQYQKKKHVEQEHKNKKLSVMSVKNPSNASSL